MRSRNEAAILEQLLADRGGTALTRAELAQRTGLSHAGLANVLSGPLRNVVSEGGRRKQPGRTGPVPATLRIDPTAGYLLAIDLAPPRVSAWLADLHGSTVTEEPISAFDDRGLDPGRAIDLGAKLSQRLLAEAAISPAELAGVAVGVPEPVDSLGALRAASPDGLWYVVDVEQELRTRLGWDCPFRLEHDAKLAALGEVWWGAVYPDLIHVLWEDRISAGIVLDGQLRRGAGGVAGEIGHIPVGLADHDRDLVREPCPRCGNVCVELVAGGKAIVGAARAAGCIVTRLDDVIAVAEHDERARRVLDRAAWYLGKSLGGIATALNPRGVSLGGSLGRAGYTHVAEGLRRGLSEGAARYAWVDIGLVVAKCGEHATLLGALALLLENERVPFLHERAYSLSESNPRTLPP